MHSDQPGDRREVQGEGAVGTEHIPSLPDPLVARGWRLVVRAPGRMFAVSEAWGCTGTKGTVNEVAVEAWGLVGFIEYVNRKRAENDAYYATAD